MIYCLTGKILKKNLDSVVISCAGVGYYVQIPATTGEALPAPGQEGTVYTLMNVTENDVSLYGFANEEQRDCFKMLTSVSGVGPKAGLSILSIMSPEKVALAASSGDHKAFTKASGVGPKWPSALPWSSKTKWARAWPAAQALRVTWAYPRPARPRRRLWRRWSAWATPPAMPPPQWPAWTKLCPYRISSRWRCAACPARAERGKQ